MQEPVFYIEGRLVPESKASVSVYDLGLLRGYGAFDFTITYHRVPFKLDNHLDRLLKSTDIIGLKIPWRKRELEELVYKTLDKNPVGEKALRIIITGGVSTDTLTPPDEPNLIIMIKPVKIYSQHCFTQGVKVITFNGKREIPEAKTLNYVHAIRALSKARQMGAEEAIYTYDGLLSECMVCSFFAVKDDRIITAGNQVLDGITRKTILTLVNGEIPVEYRFIKVSEISSLDEAFLTSSNHEIMPIVQIDDAKIGNGKPGPITKKTMKMFGEYTGKKIIED